jgi:hypothetical protein
MKEVAKQTQERRMKHNKRGKVYLGINIHLK